MKVKNKRFLWILLLLIATTLFADDSLFKTVDISVSELPTLSESVFGIRLGETPESVKKRCEEKNLQVLMDYNTNDSNRLGKVGKIYGDLVGGNCDELIIETLIYYYQERIYEVQIAFKNNSASNFRLYDNFLEKRYKRIGYDDLESRSRFCFGSDRQNVNIDLDRNADYYDPTTGKTKVLMLLTYEYIALKSFAVKEVKQKLVENLKVEPPIVQKQIEKTIIVYPKYLKIHIHKPEIHIRWDFPYYPHYPLFYQSFRHNKNRNHHRSDFHHHPRSKHFSHHKR